MPFNEVIYKSRTTDIDFPIFEADGRTPVILAATDVIRFKIGLYESATPLLDIDSVAATAAGSIVTKTDNPGMGRVRFAQADAALLNSRVYYAELAIVDDSETGPADAIKVVDRGTIEVQGSQGGDVGLT